jgi:hypothetical protein
MMSKCVGIIKYNTTTFATKAGKQKLGKNYLKHHGSMRKMMMRAFRNGQTTFAKTFNGQEEFAEWKFKIKWHKRLDEL